MYIHELNFALLKSKVLFILKLFFSYLGIGNIPNVVLSCLENHKDLGIHSEMFSDGVVDLVEAGSITNTFKKHFPGKIVGSFLIGTKKLYEFVDDNPFVGKFFYSSFNIFYC